MKNITAALIKAHADIGNAKKNKHNPHFRSTYADLESVIDAVKPALLNNDIIVMQPFEVVDGAAVLVTRLLHESGESMESRLPIPFADENPQKLGSMITYMRRYALAAMMSIAQEDDDANAAALKTQPPQPEKPAPPFDIEKRFEEIKEHLMAIDSQKEFDEYTEKARPDVQLISQYNKAMANELSSISVNKKKFFLEGRNNDQ